MTPGLLTEYRTFAGLGPLLVGFGIYERWVGMSTSAGRTVFGLDSDVLAGIAWILVGGSTAVAARRYYQRGSERG